MILPARPFFKRIERLYKLQLYRLRAFRHSRVPFRPGGRAWAVDLPLTAIESIQAGALRYSYRGTPMLKNPFELALYPLLFWQVKPRTVIEIGSFLGASAMWFADIMRNCDVDGTVLSIDIQVPVPPEPQPNVRFLEGDANNLAAALTPELLAELERPLVVIEDSTHTAETTLAVLSFFAPLMRPGEYIVIEDGTVSDLGRAHHFGGGPGYAISQFLAAHPEFAIDTSFCDRYGHNFTGNPNGYLRRL
jgi:cephalosporin hydroxylase